MSRAIASLTFVTIATLFMCVSCSKSDQQNHVTKIVIHYVDWSITTRVRLSCQELAVRGDSVSISDRTEIAEIMSVVEALQLTKMPDYDGVDARICAVFYDSLGAVSKSIGIAYTRLMEIDGQVYEAQTQELLNLMVSYLPRGYLET